MKPYQKSLILLACLSACASPPALAETISNNAAQVEKQGPAAEGPAAPIQTQPMSPGSATNPNLSPTGGESPGITSPALDQGSASTAVPSSPAAPATPPAPAPAAPQQAMPQGMPSGGIPGMGQQGMQGTPQGGMQGQGMQGAPQGGMQGQGQGMPGQSR